MQEIDPKVLENVLNGTPEKEDVKFNLDKLIKFGVVEKEVEVVPGLMVTMHVITQEEREKVNAMIPDGATSAAQSELAKVPTLTWAITKLGDENFTTQDQKNILFAKLKKLSSTIIDMIFLKYSEIFAEQFSILQQGIKKK